MDDAQTLHPAGSNMHSEMAPEPGSLVEQFGYSAVDQSHAYSSLQRSLRLGPAVSLTDGPVPRSILQVYFKERYCQLASQLPPHAVIRELVDLYFSAVDWYTMALDRCYNEALLDSWTRISPDVLKRQSLQELSRELHHFPALLFQLLAVALHFLPLDAKAALALRIHDSASLDRLSEEYSKTGLEIMALLGRQQPTITSVEHDILRLNWLKNCSRGSEAWNSLNHGVRQAQLLGLHLEPEVKPPESDESVEKSLSRLWYAEYKRRVWARLFILDAFMSLILGRPRLINREDCTAVPPLNRDFPLHPSRTVFFPPSRTDNEPSESTFLTYLYTLSTKIHDLLSARAGNKQIKDYSKVGELHDSILSIQQDLPRALAPENPDISPELYARYPHFPKIRQQMISTANSFLMNLHRPYVDSHAASRSAAVESALKVLESQQALFNLMSEHQYKLYGYSFYTIDAGIFLASLAIQRLPECHTVFDRVKSALEKAIARLAALGTRISIARTGEMVLKQCLPRIQSPPTHVNGAAASTAVSAPSPSTRDAVSSNNNNNHDRNSNLADRDLLTPGPSVPSGRASVTIPSTTYPPSTHPEPLVNDTAAPSFNNVHDNFASFSFDLQSVPPPIDAAGFTNYFETMAGGTSGLTWPNVHPNNPDNTAITNNSTSAAVAAAAGHSVGAANLNGASVSEYPANADPKAFGLDISGGGGGGESGMEFFSYGFDEYPYFFFTAGGQT
ncbi:hypothetical protein HRR86_008392 [Exophiala dermatitidis]|nr:hypothetical protein HRR77_008427 [Exophiala dermatitidis]KAJ4547398.1 hypothetical protein HRR76_000044 [Exophiala dermatitidis]KAJ4603685.1 hypothetical protein HRR85_008499 [Exophiala dermatitidis]KAJ4614238.1 hypothetical protein HRR86_008392 [Exophiala dermatitidis]KAJ4691636.1 hypothetical protein HRR87_007427 [Exophiala dermatitidis]